MSEQPIIIKTEELDSNKQSFDYNNSSNNKKILLFLGILALVVVLVLFFVFRFFIFNKNKPVETKEPVENQSGQAVLPTDKEPEFQDITDMATSTDLMIDYLSFSSFYKKNEVEARPNFEKYELPLNTKIDVINYYDVSRRINIDPVIDDINNNGFALINNPWASEAYDFYSVYGKLRDNQVPFLLTSDFLIYYHQNTLKKAFKDIEENVFFNNLWDISKDLYQRAKSRYESRLSSIGNVNDPLLEGARLETVFFAVSLELLKPQPEQIAPLGVQLSQEKFSVSEANRFSFVLSANLKDEVEAELKLIREAKQEAKSPVLLYNRDYKDFSIPSDYLNNAKLSNFYLTSKWLNSVFPLYNTSDNCADCFLDREDWRVNFIASLLITEDFNSLSQIKNRWARIYKVLSFFKGLRDDLDFINYRDYMSSAFTANYNLEELLSGDNKSTDENLIKIKAKIADYKFLEIQGGADLQLKNMIGFKVLAGSFSPDNYLLSRLIYPVVTDQLSADNKTAINTTSCRQGQGIKRCKGIPQDIINLVYPLQNNNYFLVNSNYKNYANESRRLNQAITDSVNSRNSNYWSLLALIKEYLGADPKLLPSFSSSPEWEEKNLNTAVAAWANTYIPLERFSVKKFSGYRGLENLSRWSEKYFIEPNLQLINELIAANEMTSEMLLALRVDSEAKQVVEDMKTAKNNLKRIRDIMVKDISAEKLSDGDLEFISEFVGQLEIINPIKDKSFSLKPEGYSQALKGDISNFKLLVVVNQRNGEKFFSVGPVWDYQEKK